MIRYGAHDIRNIQEWLHAEALIAPTRDYADADYNALPLSGRLDDRWQDFQDEHKKLTMLQDDERRGAWAGRALLHFGDMVLDLIDEAALYLEKSPLPMAHNTGDETVHEAILNEVKEAAENSWQINSTVTFTRRGRVPRRRSNITDDETAKFIARSFQDTSIGASVNIIDNQLIRPGFGMMDYLHCARLCTSAAGEVILYLARYGHMLQSLGYDNTLPRPGSVDIDHIEPWIV